MFSELREDISKYYIISKHYLYHIDKFVHTMLKPRIDEHIVLIARYAHHICPILSVIEITILSSLQQSPCSSSCLHRTIPLEVKLEQSR